MTRRRLRKRDIKRRKLNANRYRVPGNETKWKRVPGPIDRKCKGSIGERRSVATKRGGKGRKSALISLQGYRVSTHITETSKTVRGNLFYEECVPRCPPSTPPPLHQHEKIVMHSNCHHVRRETTYPLSLNPFHKAPMKLQHVNGRNLRSKDNLHGSFHRAGPHTRSREKAQSEYLTKPTERPLPDRKKRYGKLEDTESNLNLTDLQLMEPTSEISFNTTVTLPATLDSEEKEEEEEGISEGTTQEGERVESSTPEGPTGRYDSGVQESCHCELSNHLTCVGAHLRNISERIVGEMKHL